MTWCGESCQSVGEDACCIEGGREGERKCVCVCVCVCLWSMMDVGAVLELSVELSSTVR